ERYDEWELQVANQDERKIDQGTQAAIEEGKKIDQGTQAAIEGNKEIIKKEENLRSQVEAIQKINGVPKPDILELQKTAQNIPELQGMSQADIGSNKYNNILLADYYVTHAKDISVKLASEDAKLFQNSINSLSDTLKRPRIEDFSKLTSSLALGSARDTINDRGISLIKEGYSKSVTWDPRDRTISFQNDRGDTKVLETASIPPRERIVRNGLSISRDITQVVETLEQKNQKIIETSIQNGTKGLKENPYIGALSSVEYDESFAQAEKSKNPKEQLSYSYQGLQGKYNAISKLIEQYEQSGELAESNAMKHALTQVESQIKQIIVLANSYEGLLNQKSKDNSPNIDNFDTIARDNLSYLVDNRFDRIGIDANIAITHIIAEVNRTRIASNQIDLTRPLNTIDGQRLISILDQLGGTIDVLTNGERLSIFQQRMTTALSYNADNPNSIEGLMRATYVPTPT
ncbi:hypothetical protein H7169_00055, partial [Candidatus Gracilibacteria bacterium]|nr:hypothetical protein [Candidatus Gracilibacteria bacterium]